MIKYLTLILLLSSTIAKAQIIDSQVSPHDYQNSSLNYNEKIQVNEGEINYLKDTLSGKNDNGTNQTTGGHRTSIEDGVDVAEKERLSQLLQRLERFQIQLKHALIRINNGTNEYITSLNITNLGGISEA